VRILTTQDLWDLKDGAAIFSAGGGGSLEAGERIIENLVLEGYKSKLVAPSEVARKGRIVNFACVGATTATDYDSNAAVKTLRALEEFAGFLACAIIPVELGGFNTLVAVDVAARCGIPLVDADGAGRSVPEVHLKVYTIDDIPLTPMVVSDVHAGNVVIVRETMNLKACERIARLLATEWGQSAYTARRILTGAQIRTSPIQLTLTRSIQIGRLLRTAMNPLKALLEETHGFRLFDGFVDSVKQTTESGFTFTDITIQGIHRCKGSTMELKAKNEVLAAYQDGKLIALAPDIITPLNFETGRCVTAEKIEKDDKLAVLGISAPSKWRSSRGLGLWEDVLRRAGINDAYVPLEHLAKSNRAKH